MAYFKETEKQKEVRERETKKNNSPSPVTYKVTEAMEVASGFKFQNKADKVFTIGKAKKNTFTDKIITSAKKSPGVGHYKIEKPLDNACSRPMRPNRAF